MTDEELDDAAQAEGTKVGTLSIPNVRNRLERMEGRVSHMYLDKKGKVTVGVGFLIPNINRAYEYPWRIKRSGRRADRAMIKADWDKVRAKGKGWSARAFAPITLLELSSLDVSRILDKKIDIYREELRRALREAELLYEELPSVILEALFDMVYTLGQPSFNRQYTELRDAIAARDWAEAAEQSKRDVQAERNLEIKNLFYRQMFSEAWEPARELFSPHSGDASNP
ncbi:MAG: hypothetical protein AB7P52_04650 [Alphaproteobacteria bacterium]